MYIRTVRNSEGRAYYQVVESYWDGKRSKQRMVLSLGRVGEGGEKRLDELATAISKYRDTLTVAQLAKEITVEKTFILGPLLVLEKLFASLGINELIEAIQAQHPQMAALDLRKTLFTIVVSRFVKPGSKLKIFEHWRSVLYPEMIDTELPLHHIYRTLDVLAGHKEEIEESLYWRGRDLLSEPTDIVLYDLTTLRFESTNKIGLRQFGYSKEMRSDCTQLVFGLLLNTDGIPLGFEVYPGNTFEGNTLSGIVEKMRKKFRIRRMIFVADRGLFSAKNLEFLRQDGGEFIVGCKLGTMKQTVQNALYDLTRFDWITPGELAVLETKTETGDRLIVTWSRSRAERDAKTRTDILSKIERKIATKNEVTAKAFVTNTNYQKFVSGLDEGSRPKLNQEAIAAQARKDGFFGIVTNVEDLSARDAVINYKELWKIEDAFGEIKGTLKARPIFHWTDQRIVGHLVACFLAYFCEAQLTKLLREKKLVLKSPAIDQGPLKPRALTVAEALKELNEVRAIPVSVRGQTIWCRTDITGNAVTLFRAAGVQIPAKILKTTPNPADTNRDIAH